MMKHRIVLILWSALAFGCASDRYRSTAPPLPSRNQIDTVVQRMMSETGAKGFALAIIDRGQVSQVSVYGDRNASNAPLEANSIMYGASLTKMAFAYMVLQLVDEGVVDSTDPSATIFRSRCPATPPPRWRIATRAGAILRENCAGKR